MNAPPYPQPMPPPGYANADDSTLKTLAILHWVYGGFMVFVGLVCCVYIVLGVAVAGAIAHAPHPAKGAPPPELFGAIFTIIGGVGALFSWIKAGLVMWSAKSLGAKKRHTLCFVVACLECIAVPFGTALGVFTIITLNKPQVKATFDAAS